MDSGKKKWLTPFSLTAFVIVLDQITKAFIVAHWPNPGTLIWPSPGAPISSDVFNDKLLLLFHVRNKAIAFSIGDTIPPGLRFVLFVIVPIAVLVFLVWYYFNTAEFSMLQRWAVAGIIGGGVGNIIDRIFRKDGVVDFVSVKFYGLLGMQRWPTFNVADASVVICCFILIFTMLRKSPEIKNSKEV